MPCHRLTVSSRHGLLSACLFLCAITLSCARTEKIENGLTGSPVIIVDASDLIDHLAREHVFMDNSRFGGAWLFNNSAVELTVRPTMQGSVNLQTRVNIPRTGTYHVFVRTAGPAGSSLRVAVGEKIFASVPCDSIMTWNQVGTVDLARGEEIVWITRVNRSPALDVVVLAMDGDFSEEDLAGYQYQGEVELVKEYPVGRVNAVKFGDLEGDGKTDFLVLDPGYSAYMYNYEGELLWVYESPEEGTASDEVV